MLFPAGDKDINGLAESAVKIDDFLASASEPRAFSAAAPAPSAGRGQSTSGQSRRRRTPLTASLLQRLGFLSRAATSTSSSAPAVSSSMQHEEDAAAALSTRPVRTRKRKGSLRKTALLGPGRVKHEPPATLPANEPPTEHVAQSIDEALEDALETATSSSSTIRQLSRRLSLVSESSPASSPPRVPSVSPHPDLASPIISPTSQTSQSCGSTTDDDDLSMASTVGLPYFDSNPLAVPRRRVSQKSAPSPLSAVLTESAIDDVHDYTQTERWGWFLLIVTWFVFAIGMGSCLGVWSWAWDVSQKPYAPPELEDDPTLPIVGYYPALIILTSVMAWVWVVVAWVGMKYFKHAKIQGDD